MATFYVKKIVICIIEYINIIAINGFLAFFFTFADFQKIPPLRDSNGFTFHKLE